jgi:hypothetical protein
MACFDFRVAPVEVGLLFHEVVIIVLVALRDVGPGVAVEAGLPVVGRNPHP